jgi:hypothetical protein
LAPHLPVTKATNGIVRIDMPAAGTKLGAMQHRPWAMRVPFAVRLAAVLGFFVLVAGACAGSAAGTPPSTPATGTIDTPEAAIIRVVAEEPRLGGIQPFDSGMIGQSSWYAAEPAADGNGYVVTVRVGWGDCESGCIDEHSWVFDVARGGQVSVASEAGPDVPAEAWPSPAGDGRTGIQGVALAGPVCPVETVPPDPDCAARPVADATVVIRDAGGAEVARSVTAADGSFFVELEAGDYVVEPQPAEGLMGTPSPEHVTVVAGRVVSVQLEYDTGIR